MRVAENNLDVDQGICVKKRAGSEKRCTSVERIHENI